MDISVGLFVTTPLQADAIFEQPGSTDAKLEEVNLDETQTFRMFVSGPLINTNLQVYHHLCVSIKSQNT